VTCSSTTCTATAPTRIDGAGFIEVQVTVTVNGYTSIQSVPFQYGTQPVPGPCKGTGCS
jgi:hypothetical protein